MSSGRRRRNDSIDEVEITDQRDETKVECDVAKLKEEDNNYPREGALYPTAMPRLLLDPYSENQAPHPICHYADQKQANGQIRFNH